ncbi:MAG: ArsR family transcriptional regulator [Cystobacterineae bacterium]|nr:ArsR family transcriptional regulator [Cystobacterineae bacterium]
MRTEYLKDLPPHWQPAAAVFAALGDETRQRILLLFEEGEELSIKTITSQFGFGRSTIVHHLAILEKVGALSSRRVGKLALYSVRPLTVLDALEKLRVYIEEEFTAASRACRRNLP